MDGRPTGKGKENNHLSDEVSKPAQIITQIIPDPRADEVKTLLCKGLDRTTILQYATQFNWDATHQQIDDWISVAQLQLAEDAGAIDTEAELGKAIARLTWLYMQATKVQDFKTGLAVQKEISKVLTLKITAAGSAAKAQPQAGKFRLKIAK